MRKTYLHLVCLAALLPITGSGCLCGGRFNMPRTPPRGDQIIPPDVPVEMSKVTHPEYVIEAPDILQISSIQAVPRQPYKIQSFDTLAVTVLNTLPNNPIEALYVVGPEGFIDFGPTYKRVKVVDLSPEDAQKAIETHLMSKDIGLLKPVASVTVAQTRGMQQIAGEHLVRADGTVYLGVYGNVRVTGLTLTQAKAKIEEHLTTFLHKPEITLDVLAYNSKVLYVIFDGAGAGQQVYRLPITGNETVLDAISQVNGLGPVSDKHHLWVARPAPPKSDCGDQVMPVDWVGITTRGRTETNYQLLPGDRLYVKAYTATTLDYTMARIFAPVERVFGIVLLGTSTVQSFSNRNGFGNNNNFP